MGLCITAHTSHKKISWSFDDLHLVRSLAVFADSDIWNHQRIEGELWEKCSTYYQLLHFSDQEGLLIPEWSLETIDYIDSFYLGSSTKLWKELQLLKDNIARNPAKYADLTDTVKLFNELYDLVEEEMTNGTGIFQFA